MLEQRVKKHAFVVRERDKNSLFKVIYLVLP